MKKLINRAEDVVREALEGMAAAHPDLSVSFDPSYIVRADAPVAGKVGIVSGGGSGHEPLHVGFVGPGMLDAACPGEPFTSPTPDQMLEATRMVNGDAGVLHVVKNYSGDVMNFELAQELAREEGIEVESVLVSDDVAIEDRGSTAGRRGVGTTVLVEKICGAAADAGCSLGQVAGIGRRVCEGGRSMGMALTSCTSPLVGRPTFELGDDEMEMGIGIHGERGRTRMSLRPADEIVEMLAEPILSDLPYRAGDAVLAFVNGMGGTPLSELYVVYRKLHEILAAKEIRVVRHLIGSYLTSFDMAGCSITLLKMDDALIELWDAPVKTPALRWRA